MIRSLPTALALVLAAAGCDSAPTSVDDLTQDPALLVGSWTLERTQSEGDFDGPVDYNGPVQRLVFRADGTLTRTTLGEPTFDLAGPYGVDAGQIYVVVSNGRWWLGQFGVDADDLLLDDRATDGGASFYRRAE